MKEYKINLDLFCYRKNDVVKEYRLYLDGDLITERSYTWLNKLHDRPTGQFVRENIWVELEPGEHEFKIEPLDANFAGFLVQNVRVNDEPAQMTSKTRFTISE